MISQHDDLSLPADGELVALEVDGTAVAVAVLDGQVHAFDDTCPHAGCSLAEGELEDDSVVCPCHFARFDITTGAVVEGSTDQGVRAWPVSYADGTLELRSPQDAEPPSGPTQPPSSSPAPAAGMDPDLTVLIEREHDSFRRQFEVLERCDEPAELRRAWQALAESLEIHASGEESVLYPVLVHAAEQVAPEAEDAVRDHNEIRDSVRTVEQHDAGSTAWWDAVRTARTVNEEHLQEEERDVLPAFRDSVDRARREELGAQWLAPARARAERAECRPCRGPRAAGSLRSADDEEA